MLLNSVDKKMKEIKSSGEASGELDLKQGVYPWQGIQDTWDKYRESESKKHGFDVFYNEFKSWQEGYLVGNPL